MPSSVSGPTAATGFHRLPEETLRQIILQIYSPQATESKYWSPTGLDARISWLCASIPLSRAWASQAYPILYHTVPLDARWRAVSFLNSITNRPLLAAFVRCLTMFAYREDPATADGVVLETRPWWRPKALHARAGRKARQNFWQPYFDIRRLCSALTSLSIEAADHPLLDIHPQPHLLIITDIANRLDLSGLEHLQSLRLVGIGERSYVSIQLPDNGTGRIDWNLHTLVLHDIRVALDDILHLLSCVSSTLRNLTCYSVEVLDGWRTVPMSEWTSPVRGSLSSFSVGGYYTELRTLRILSSVTSLEIHVTASESLPRGKPEDYLPPTVEKLSLLFDTSGPSIFSCAHDVWRVVKADRTALLYLRQVVVGFTVYNPEDLHTWRLLIFLVKESTAISGVEVQFNANIAYWHGGESFQWHPPPDRNAGQPGLSVASGSHRSSLFQRSLTLFRRW